MNNDLRFDYGPVTYGFYTKDGKLSYVNHRNVALIDASQLPTYYSTNNATDNENEAVYSYLTNLASKHNNHVQINPKSIANQLKLSLSVVNSTINNMVNNDVITVSGNNVISFRPVTKTNISKMYSDLYYFGNIKNLKHQLGIKWFANYIPYKINVAKK